ncbi:MAG: DUF4125 family protein [Deltaproteobacteria bacterium]|nr:DUF4125 family protein [Deltaproteobacteria bacterium]
MPDKEKLIAEILELELKMFISVPSDGVYSCQENPEGFRIHRGAQFIVWSDDTLKSYMDDLQRAEKEGLNLMTIKYARMDNIIPRKNLNPLVDAITEIELRWQREMFAKYPSLMAGARRLMESENMAGGTSFETYLKSELETYSDNTLSLLHRDLSSFEKTGINGSEKVYEHLSKIMGYGSVKEADRLMGTSIRN